MPEQTYWWKYYLGWVLKNEQELLVREMLGEIKFSIEEFIEYPVILSTTGLKIILAIISAYVKNV